jgi:phytoene dehydrogenase-like protein
VSVAKVFDATFDAIVVGGGHNGLVAASYLAKGGKRVLLLEANSELGGATASVRAFPDFDARLSRYSYLVSLLPDQIVADLGINFHTRSRQISSYTPYHRNGVDDGLRVSSQWDEATEQSFIRLTGSEEEGLAWQKFYSEIAQFAAKAAPLMLSPLLTRSQMRALVDMDDVWDYMIERPIGEIIESRFRDDVVRGVVLTDALIGTFVDSESIQANICFLYHLIGNGIGQWNVPVGGMGALVAELERIARELHVEIQLNSPVTQVTSTDNGVTITCDNGDVFKAVDLLFAAAPQSLAKLRKKSAPSSLQGSQLKINMLLTRLPQLKSGVDPRVAFAGTFHINETYSHLNESYRVAKDGDIPTRLPLEMYCHTLTDSSILSPELVEKGFHTLTLFGLHTDASLFDRDPEGAREQAVAIALASLNEYLAEPIESVIALNADGSLALEAKSPLDLEAAIGLPRGNIFHRDLDFPFIEDSQATQTPQWGSETDDPHIFIAGAGARRGGGVSGIAGHNAAMAVLSRQ